MSEEKIKLYSLATPNGQKVGIALEEMEIPYEAHTIDIRKDEQFTKEFLKINPNGKIPAIVDPSNELSLFESGAILQYLAEKTGKFLPKETKPKYKTLQWLYFQMGGIGPMFGQFGHFFKYAKDRVDDPYPLDRYLNETKRLLAVVDKQLENNEFIAGDELTIADFSIMPWVDCLDKFYEAGDTLNLESYKNINSWKTKLLDRPKVQKGMKVCDFD